MPLFKYRAVDTEGNSIDGTMEGPFAHQVVVALQEQGLAVNAVRQVGKDARVAQTRPLSWNDLAQLNNQLRIATKSGLPLAPSLAAMAEDIDTGRVKIVLDDVRRHLESGNSLQSALERHPGTFSPVYRALVAAGERSGDLPRVFQTLAAYANTMQEVKHQIQVALAYPLMVVAFALLLLAGMIVKIVPLFESVYQDFGRSLPAPTELLLKISHFSQNHFWALILILAIVPVLSFWLLYRRSENQSFYWRDWLCLKIPVIGRMYTLTSIMQFCRALSMLLQARIPLLESLELAGAAAGNSVLQRRIRRAARDVNAGASLSQALQGTQIFDSGASWLVSNGEKSGNIEEVLDVIAEEGARSLAYLYRSFSVVIGPAIIVTVGLTVGYILVALYLPVFVLGDALNS